MLGDRSKRGGCVVRFVDGARNIDEGTMLVLWQPARDFPQCVILFEAVVDRADVREHPRDGPDMLLEKEREQGGRDRLGHADRAAPGDQRVARAISPTPPSMPRRRRAVTSAAGISEPRRNPDRRSWEIATRSPR